MRRSSRLPPANPKPVSGDSKLAKPRNDGIDSTPENQTSKRPRRGARAAQQPLLSGEAAATKIGAAAGAKAVASPHYKETPTVKTEADDHGRTTTTEGGPSAYELARLENIKRNAIVMASLGLGEARGEEAMMLTAVKSDAAKRAKSRGLNARRQPKKVYPEIRRESARVRGKTPEGLPMEDPEEVFSRSRGQRLVQVPETPRTASRLAGDVSMDASNASADGTLRLRKMMGGLVGRYGLDANGGGDGDGQDFELAEPDELLGRLRGLKVEETGVCKVVRERAYSLAWHPSRDKLLLAVGDKVGNVGLWTAKGGEKNVAAKGKNNDEDDGDDGDDGDEVFQFKPHTGSVPRLAFDTLDGNKLISTSYDGTVRRMDVEKGAFEQVFANNASEDSFFTDGHLMAEERTILLSDGVGDITAVDLRTNNQIWKREAHEKKANTVDSHPVNRHLFVTASLDRSVKLWDLRNLGAGTGADGVGGMKAIAEMPHFRSVNSAHFSPGGEWLATVGQDDKVKLYKDLEKHSGGSKVPMPATHVLPHNNQTGRWLTKFQASWDPKSKGLFAIGSLQRNPHGLHLYSVNAGAKKPSAVELVGGEVMTSIQSLLAFHPSRDLLGAVNSSGRAHIFS